MIAWSVSATAYCLVSEDLDFLRWGFSAEAAAASWAAFFELDRFLVADDIFTLFNLIYFYTR